MIIEIIGMVLAYLLCGLVFYGCIDQFVRHMDKKLRGVAGWERAKVEYYSAVTWHPALMLIMWLAVFVLAIMYWTLDKFKRS